MLSSSSTLIAISKHFITIQLAEISEELLTEDRVESTIKMRRCFKVVWERLAVVRLNHSDTRNVQTQFKLNLNEQSYFISKIML
ncbi:hypothetical protein WN51_14621 [Melipona quadrifasciata]|uniref:Uncharacterized protein n=1 Tax=Melipona quadrifasciata TaxID=166423 RepID=A0A0N0BFC4_9HYME|nr:hypothetical protein WN51_14621 [Melipona quadrifasciata]